MLYYWGLGIGDWGLGIGPNPQSPIPKHKFIYKQTIISIDHIFNINNIINR